EPQSIEDAENLGALNTFAYFFHRFVCFIVAVIGGALGTTLIPAGCSRPGSESGKFSEQSVFSRMAAPAESPGIRGRARASADQSRSRSYDVAGATGKGSRSSGHNRISLCRSRQLDLSSPGTAGRDGLHPHRFCRLEALDAHGLRSTRCSST